MNTYLSSLSLGMRASCLFLLACVSGISAVHAQANFESALLILHSGDTLTGAIDNRDWERNPELISFRNADGALADYSPHDIRGFRFTGSGEWYESAALMIDKSPLNTAEVLRRKPGRNAVVDTVFLRGLVRGRLSLYSHIDEYMRRHFIIGKDSLVELNIEKRIVRVRTGQEFSLPETPREGVLTIEHYKDQLAAAIADCNTSPKNTDKVSYTERAISAIVVSYNNCFPGGSIEVRPVPKVKSRVYVGAGINSSSLTLEGSAYGFNNQGTYNDVTPFGAVGYEAVLPRNRGTWSVLGEAMYRSYAMGDTFAASQVKLTFQLRYTFLPDSRVRPFAGGGLTYGYTLSSESPLIISKPGGPKEQQFRKHELGFPAEAGVQAGRFSISVRYELADGFSKYPSTPTPFNLWYGILSVRLTK
jgi:hypothetical protein